MLPFVRLCYGAPSTFVWTDDEGVSHLVSQGEGGEQGDPLMPALFALALADGTDVERPCHAPDVLRAVGRYQIVAVAALQLRTDWRTASRLGVGRCGEGQRCGASVEHSGMGSVAGAASTGASDVQAPSQERGAGLSGTVTKGEAVRGGEERARRIAA
ncbi:hypothetical protein AK812_SmicGene30452 [Symbiodinium microadriaticum]|uniref:Reverse transcriptase domain-containing protein n=1 Tax=Symbiodinium microadriaticum TaxID=2951 RepID=A0A1Q9CZA3_SYMMI|nr:hypothetical protein AK812_SmicGene30452 [Symbiodinium microadriaticum]